MIESAIKVSGKPGSLAKEAELELESEESADLV